MTNIQGGAKKSSLGSFLRTIKLVLWGFLGVRKNSEWQEDAQKTSPLHIILVGLVGVFLLIGGLIALVNWVVPS